MHMPHSGKLIPFKLQPTDHKHDDSDEDAAAYASKKDAFFKLERKFKRKIASRSKIRAHAISSPKNIKRVIRKKHQKSKQATEEGSLAIDFDDESLFFKSPRNPKALKNLEKPSSGDLFKDPQAHQLSSKSTDLKTNLKDRINFYDPQHS